MHSCTYRFTIKEREGYARKNGSWHVHVMLISIKPLSIQSVICLCSNIFSVVPNALNSRKLI